MHDDVREAVRRAVEGDATIPLTVAAEAALSSRSVTRWLRGERIRPNTAMAIVRAWGRIRTRETTTHTRA
jgi:hypothetical protein